MKKTISLLVGVLLLLSLCACGQSGGYAREAAYQSAPAEMPMAEEAYWDADWEEAEYNYSGLSAKGGEALPEDAEPQKGDLQPDKIIYSGSATVETTDFELTLEKLEAMIKQYGGFVESSSINGSNYYSQSRGYANSRSASYTLRVPSEQFQTLMGSLSTLGNVPYTYVSSDNITARYYDVQARLTAYQTQEQRLLEMMEAAETVSDIITIEDRLTELRYQIESLQSSLKNWDRQVSYSSVSVSVNEVTVYTPEVKMSYGERLSLAVRTGLQNTGDFFAEFLLWFLEALPAIVILAALTVLTVFLIRRGAKKRRAKKAAEEARLAEIRAAREAEKAPKAE